MMATLATSQKHWSTPLCLKLFYPWIVRLSFWKRKRNQTTTNLFTNPFPSIWAIELKSEQVACKNNHLLTLRVRCIYNLHICTFKEQSMDSPPNDKVPKACIYFTMQSYGCYVAKTKSQFIFELWFWAMLGLINNHQF